MKKNSRYFYKNSKYSTLMSFAIILIPQGNVSANVIFILDR